MKTVKLMLVLALLLPSVILSKQKDEQFELTKFDDTSYVLIGKEYGTNVGVIMSDNGILLIDPMPGEKALDELHSLIRDISVLPISYVANTHSHEDHIGGNEYFNSKGATILDGVNEAPASASGIKKMILRKEFGVDVVQEKSHTSQDYLYFHSASNVLFVGDVFDNSWHPTFYAGGIKGFTETIDKILSIGNQNTVIVPGHGTPANKEVVKAFYENTIVWLKRVSELNKEKLSVDQIMKDDQINEILQRFNTENRPTFIPSKAFRRFIERTVSIVSSN
ncbi:MBL fold metallo-hydrolase [Arenicella sp. 4NH20-0111]|uniref:MBL fold metallo-hydrolase n=1 Tax=Arenicella sp. 4NH20-0111 TaxID=3127648 RepID=UPI003105FBEE